MKYWDYKDFDGGLEDTIQALLERGKTITNVTILKYAQDLNSKQFIMFPVRALIIYK